MQCMFSGRGTDRTKLSLLLQQHLLLNLFREVLLNPHLRQMPDKHLDRLKMPPKKQHKSKISKEQIEKQIKEKRQN